MKLLFVWSAAEFATFDVARGYCRALRRQGHEVSEYRLYNRLKYHALALANDKPPRHHEAELVTRLASETMVVEALREEVDLVVGVCGMGVHPDGLELLRRAGFPIAMIFTEAPYDDENQARFARMVGHPFANERVSSRVHGWGYLPAAYDPELHRPRLPVEAEACDVLIVGTGWPERQALLEAVDWTGIRLRVLGWWMGIKEGSPLWPHYEQGAVDNEDASYLYSSALVCVNQHRAHPTAESLNPRAFELAASGAYQVSDRRVELAEVFGETVPTYGDAEELEALIREALTLPREELRQRAGQQRAQMMSGGHTFDNRAASLMAEITGGS